MDGDVPEKNTKEAKQGQLEKETSLIEREGLRVDRYQKGVQDEFSKLGELQKSGSLSEHPSEKSRNAYEKVKAFFKPGNEWLGAVGCASAINALVVYGAGAEAIRSPEHHAQIRDMLDQLGQMMNMKPDMATLAVFAASMVGISLAVRTGMEAVTALGKKFEKQQT